MTVLLVCLLIADGVNGNQLVHSLYLVKKFVGTVWRLYYSTVIYILIVVCSLIAVGMDGVGLQYFHEEIEKVCRYCVTNLVFHCHFNDKIGFLIILNI